MKKIAGMVNISGILNDEILKSMGNALNDGYEILRLDTSWQQQSFANNTINITPAIIAILVKYE